MIDPRLYGLLTAIECVLFANWLPFINTGDGDADERDEECKFQLRKILVVHHRQYTLFHLSLHHHKHKGP
jgi:hypothetical protein